MVTVAVARGSETITERERVYLYFCFVLLRIKYSVMMPNPEIGFGHLRPDQNTNKAS